MCFFLSKNKRHQYTLLFNRLKRKNFQVRKILKSVITILSNENSKYPRVLVLSQDLLTQEYDKIQALNNRIYTSIYYYDF